MSDVTAHAHFSRRPETRIEVKHATNDGGNSAGYPVLDIGEDLTIWLSREQIKELRDKICSYLRMTNHAIAEEIVRRVHSEED